MVSQVDARLPTVLKRLALAFALLVSTLLPAAYFGVQYDGLVDHVQTTARVKAESIETLVVRNPEMWVYELARMEDLLQQYPMQLERERVAVRSLAGEDLVAAGEPQTAPVLTRAADITDSGRAVARIELAHSYRQIVINTLIAALLGSVLGPGRLCHAGAAAAASAAARNRLPVAGEAGAGGERGALSQPDRDVLRFLLGDRHRAPVDAAQRE